MRFFNTHKVVTLLIVNIIIFLSTFLLLEIGMRIFYPEMIPLVYQARKYWEYDSLLGWSHKQNAKGIQIVGEKIIDIEINSKKLRGKEYDYQRNEKKRVLVLGDSFAWGFGVQLKERFTELIESRNTGIEIINAAVAGYSSDQQLLYFQNEGYKYKPDVVLLLFYENDFLGNYVDKIYWYNKPKYVNQDGSMNLTNVPVPQQSFYQKFRRYLSGKSYLISFILKRISKLMSNHILKQIHPSMKLQK